MKNTLVFALCRCNSPTCGHVPQPKYKNNQRISTPRVLNNMKHIKERLDHEVAINYIPYYTSILKKRILHQARYIKPLKKVLYLFALALSFEIPEEDYPEYHITPCDFTTEEMNRVQHIVDIDYTKEDETKGHSVLDMAWKQALRELSSMCESTKLNYSKILYS